jgi:hypothetical protein
MLFQTDSPAAIDSFLLDSVDRKVERADLSCFELLAKVRRNLYLQAEKLRSMIIAATKDDSGSLTWVEFEPNYHSHLLVLAHRAVEVTLTAPAERQLRKCLFIYVLDLLNGCSGEKFFELQTGARLQNRELREKKRLARKRSRAAKREREREAKALARVVGDSPHTCGVCGRKFTSRKTLSRHTCVTKAVKLAREEKLRKEAHSTAAPKQQVDDQDTTRNPPPVKARLADELKIPDSLPGSLRRLIRRVAKAGTDVDKDALAWIEFAWREPQDSRVQMCETCDDTECRRAVHFKMHGSVSNWYPKCELHRPLYDYTSIPEEVLDWFGHRA